LNTSPNGGVAVARGWAVRKLDAFEKKAILEDGYEITYEKCLIATGKQIRDVQWVYCSTVYTCAVECKIKVIFAHSMLFWTQMWLFIM
jgi:NADPH-dependent 2,4-dienoyl-CoA reductase/sulfur reductase-like enzyme